MKVIITGAGPCGLLLSVLLAKDGVDVTVVDGADKLDSQPRAINYPGPSTIELERAGVLDQIKKEGLLPSSLCWRTLDGKRVAGIRNTYMSESDVLRMVVLPLGRVIEILHEHAVAAGVSIKLSHRVVTLDQDDNGAWVNVDTGSAEGESLRADYIVGCDGANSQIRRCLFGDRGFPGWTWDHQIIATNVYYDFERFGYEDVNFIIHPENWYMAAKITKDGMWRVSYGDVAGLSKAEYEQRLPMRFKEILPGQPEPDQYHVTNVGPYKMHQRCAKRMRVGRFLLAGDAAHLCNPFGGMGLTGGIADIGGLYECLRGIHNGVVNEDILDRYCETRREIYQTMVNPISTENFRRLYEENPENRIANDPFFKVLQRAEADTELSYSLAKDLLLLRHDFTQYYQNGSGLTTRVI